jgi:hypothetical protein
MAWFTKTITSYIMQLPVVPSPIRSALLVSVFVIFFLRGLFRLSVSELGVIVVMALGEVMVDVGLEETESEIGQSILKAILFLIRFLEVVATAYFTKMLPAA